jgi:glycosyltransferase involved in cell wall biosynthesis
MLSIIIPTLNEEKIIAQTLKALRALNIIDYEIIVSDGASTDRTVQIAKKYADKVIVHHGTERQNIAQGKNLGAAHAKGNFLVFIDADVQIPEINAFFNEALTLFKKDKDLIALTVFLKVFPEEATIGDKLVFGFLNRMNQFYNNIFGIGGAPGEFQMIRTEFFKKAGGYNQQMIAGEDYDMFARLAKYGKTRIEKKLYVLHSRRRVSALGWPKLISLWYLNFLYTKITGKAFSKEWKVIR